MRIILNTEYRIRHTQRMQIQRLKGRKATDYLRRRGNVWKGKTMVVVWLPGHPWNVDADRSMRSIYVSATASSKLHKSAVKRNRMRRRCREAFRTIIKDHEKLPTVQLLISPRSSSLDCVFGDIQADVHRFLSVITHG